MTLGEQCALSYYKEIAVLDEHHHVVLMQHQESRKIYVKKSLALYDPAVFLYLKEHPVTGTPRIYEAVEDGDTLIVIEEYVPGSTLKELLLERGAFPENEAAAIAAQLCGILAGLHSCTPPIIHRDIKPSNIIISTDGIVKLIDMDAAKRVHKDGTEDTRLMGTSGYAAPEQYGFGTSDQRTDIYAVGVLMNELVTGTRPGTKKAGGSLAPVIEKCTAMEPGSRYQDISELQNAINNVINGSPLEDPGKNPSSSASSSFLLPGFRTHTPWKMFSGAIGYLAVILLSLSVTVGTPGIDRVLNKISVFAALMLAVLFSADYMGIQKSFPLTRSRNRLLRFFGIIFWDIMIFCFVVFVLVVIEDVFVL